MNNIMLFTVYISTKEICWFDVNFIVSRLTFVLHDYSLYCQNRVLECCVDHVQEIPSLWVEAAAMQGMTLVQGRDCFELLV